MGPFFAILRNTVLETVRQPVYGLVVAVTVCVIALTPATAAQIYSFRVASGLDRAAERMIADLGLASLLLAGLLLSIFASTSVISREIDERTAGTVLSKNIRRPTFVVAKFCGVALSIVAATATGMLVLLLTLRRGEALVPTELTDVRLAAALLVAVGGAIAFATWRNYRSGRSWIGSCTLAGMVALAVTFGVFSLFDEAGRLIFSPESTGVAGTFNDPDVLVAGLLTLEAILVMTGVSVAASTRLGTVGNAALTGAVFASGLTSEFFFGSLRTSGETAVGRWFAEAMYTAVPSLERFWVSDALLREIPLPASYVAATSAYAACYLGAMLLLGGVLMEKRDVP